MRLSDHNQCLFGIYMMSQVDTLTVNYIIVHMPMIQPYEYYSTTQKSIHDVAWFSTGYKSLHLFTDILTVAQVAVSHIKLFHSTSAGVTRMQLAKVVITSVLVLAACAEGLPEGKSCVLKGITYFGPWLL